MFRILASSRIVLNRHITDARQYANNMRLYEATGVGSLLVTDAKENLADLFRKALETVLAGYGPALIAAYRGAGHEPEERHWVS